MAHFDSIEFPSPSEFLDISRQLQDDTEKRALLAIPNVGEKLPKCYGLVGQTLYFLDAMGSCLGVCEPESHDITYLCARAASFGRASLRLTGMGHYDESLLLTRSVGEVANLLTLLAKDGTALTEWRDGTRRFAPKNVRNRLEKAFPGDRFIGVDEETYGLLSRRTAHVNRQQLDLNAFNTLGVPTSGNRFQKAGLVICVNELAFPLALVCISSANLLGREIELHQRGRETALELIRNIGGVNLLEYQRRQYEIDGDQVKRMVRELSIDEHQRAIREIQSRWRINETKPQTASDGTDGNG